MSGRGSRQAGGCGAGPFIITCICVGMYSWVKIRRCRIDRGQGCGILQAGSLGGSLVVWLRACLLVGSNRPAYRSSGCAIFGLAMRAGHGDDIWRGEKLRNRTMCCGMDGWGVSDPKSCDGGENVVWLKMEKKEGWGKTEPLRSG